MRVVALLLALVASSAIAFQPLPTTVVLDDVKVIDGTGRPPLEHASLVINGERIQAVLPASKRGSAPADAQRLKLSGMTVMPGLINTHGHLGQTKDNTVLPANYTLANIEDQLLQYEFAGVTTVVSLGQNSDSGYDIRDNSLTGAVQGATFLTAGRGIGMAGGLPPQGPGPDQLYRPKTVEEAIAAVREMAPHRPDMIKIWVDDAGGKQPKMTPAMYTAIIAEAHKLNMKVAAHVFYLADAKALIRAGLDVLAHSIRDKAVDAELISLMKEHKTWLIPTLRAEESGWIFADKPAWMNTAFFQDSLAPELRKLFFSPEYARKILEDPTTPGKRQLLDLAKQNLKTLSKAGVNIAFGTDSGSAPNRVQGFDEHRELYLMVAAGMTPMAAIRAATLDAARMLAIDELTGSIEAGKMADLMIVAGDPLKSIGNTTRIASVYHRGAEIVPLRDLARIQPAIW